MTTISTPSNPQAPIMPLPMPSYAYRYPNSDSQPYSSLPDRTGIYNQALPSTYNWENHFPEKKENLTFLGPDWFKEAPKHYALAPNWPRENYGPLNVGSNRLLSSKGYVPHFTNKTHQSWNKFLSETPERHQVSSVGSTHRVELGSGASQPNLRTPTLDSSATPLTGAGADFTQRPVMALSSQHRNNDGYRHASLINVDAWKPYGNSPAYFNNYITGAPKFS